MKARLVPGSLKIRASRSFLLELPLVRRPEGFDEGDQGADLVGAQEGLKGGITPVGRLTPSAIICTKTLSG